MLWGSAISVVYKKVVLLGEHPPAGEGDDPVGSPADARALSASTSLIGRPIVVSLPVCF
jgi:hypothetical protein